MTTQDAMAATVTTQKEQGMTRTRAAIDADMERLADEHAALKAQAERLERVSGTSNRIRRSSAP